MATASYGSITKEDVAAFRRHMKEEKKTLTPARAREQLISSGFLLPDGKVRYPNPQGDKPNGTKRVNGRE